MREAGEELVLPPISAPFIVEKLMEIGPVMPGGTGPIVLSWCEISAWAEMTGFPLEPWESQLIRKLSGEYLSMFNEAKKPTCPNPWQAPGERDPKAVATKVRNAFRGLMASQRGR